jgi:hypothetical protein
MVASSFGLDAQVVDAADEFEAPVAEFWVIATDWQPRLVIAPGNVRIEYFVGREKQEGKPTFRGEINGPLEPLFYHFVFLFYDIANGRVADTRKVGVIAVEGQRTTREIEGSHRTGVFKVSAS